MAKEPDFLTVKYLTGLGQSLAVPIYTVDIGTARLWPNPVKYFMLLRGCLCARTHMLACWLLGVIELKNLFMGYGKIVKTSRGFGIQVCTPTATPLLHFVTQFKRS